VCTTAHLFCFSHTIHNGISTEQSEAHQFALLDVPHQCFLFTAPPLRAPGYELHRGVGSYKIHSEPKTWHEAHKICAQEGAHLAIINSEQESRVLQSIFASVVNTQIGECRSFVLIGFHDLYNEGQYLTVFGK
jgi:hypothetical protein